MSPPVPLWLKDVIDDRVWKKFTSPV